MRTNILEWIGCFTLEFLTALYFISKINIYKGKYMYLFLALFSIFTTYTTYGNIYFVSIIPTEIIFIIMNIFYIVISKRKNEYFIRNLFLINLYMCGLFLISTFTTFLSIYLFGSTYIGYDILLLIKLIQLIYLIVIFKILDLNNCIPDKVLIVLSVMFLIIKYITVMLIKLYKYFKIDFGISLLLILICLFLIFIFFIFIINIMSKYFESLYLEKLEQEKLRSLDSYAKATLDLFEEMRVWNHDLKNHMNTMLSLLESNAEEDLKSYISNLDNEIININKIVYTDNIVLDSVLNYKINYLSQKNIDINLDINLNNHIIISDLDIVTLMSNLIDNSIEACENLEYNKWIYINISTKDNKLYLKISNTIDTISKPFNLKTDKKTGFHGIGLVQIDKVVKKYNGIIKRSVKSNTFETLIIMDNKNI